ncbi:hypothetical protein [Cellvibrio sp. KY-YJ-3]|uniref:hypothetical protein n=1 Tax=Cellvibrio sp. KY-YJ-3 TaxID=454662 RepID=UPI0012461F96|nr:hypothetical protein [Cellvibrio sp. KY-YJ-3]QEY11299.1 hypothetical protein D0B88_02910 [Cellvibrio sp. KY-YJ-3]
MNKSPIAFLVAAYASASALAAPTEVAGSDFGATISLSAQQTDNALKTQTDELSEQQNQLMASAFALYNNEYIALNSDYAVSQMRYEKDSQEERTTTIGKTDFVLGKPHNPFDLKISHSLQKLPKSSAALELESNTDEKQILSVQPGFRTRITGADNFFINANATEVEYRFEEQKNSSRTGVSTGVIHAFSAVDSLSVYLTQSDVEFEFNPDVDYSQTMAVVALETRLRKINYRIELGQSRTDSSRLGKSDDPYYAVQMNYDAGHHQLGLAFNQQITDSSRGFDANAAPGEIPGGSDVTADQLDQVLLRHAELRWSTSVLCGRCDFYLSVYRDEHQFQSLERDEERLGGALGLGYQLSRSATLGFNASRVENKFAATVNDSEFTLDQITVYYNYAFAGGFNLRLFAAEYERSSVDASNEYQELRAGATIGYRF